MDRSTKQKINKETQTLNDSMDQLDLIDICRTFHHETMNFTFFSSAYGIFKRKLKAFQASFFYHNVLRLDVNYRLKAIKNTNTWRLDSTLLSNQQMTEEIKNESKICIEMNQNENTTTQKLWDSVKAILMRRFIAIQAYLKKQEKNQINNLILHLKQLAKKK